MPNDALKNKLAKLRIEHRKLDDDIDRLSAQPNHDELAVQRLKKRKLQLKDEIRKAEANMLPDIIA
ncbi:DUF465 domain-containing protein [Candidatus Bealeia paramacronuclearis]|uniref:DUF465 domain-containing protein n=1 Tax=Candidatus Bealeia paramacronuclearis TaxID=1921001 RepID=A0ABZ2C2V1_9PROT|nr:hypothetical protein [Candidatus Bealeia paramacronuclearis]